MRLKKQQNTPADEIRRAVIAAAISALEDAQQNQGKAKKRRSLGAPAALAAGAVLFTAGRAALEGGRYLRDRLGPGRDGDEDYEEYDEDELYDEPDARADEDYEPENREDDEEYYDEDEPDDRADEEDEYEEDEPEAGGDEGEDEEEPPEEPKAEGDDEHEEADEEPEAEEAQPEPELRRPKRAKKGTKRQPALELPSRSRRTRATART